MDYRQTGRNSERRTLPQVDTILRQTEPPLILFGRQLFKILLSLVITLICGFSGILFYLLSGEVKSPSYYAERFVAYLLAWPLIVREHLGGVNDFMGRYTPSDKWVVWSAWIGLWIYYYCWLLFALRGRTRGEAPRE
jgi:hypothetical protein